jgi:hypothetical protein
MSLTKHSPFGSNAKLSANSRLGSYQAASAAFIARLLVANLESARGRSRNSVIFEK